VAGYAAGVCWVLLQMLYYATLLVLRVVFRVPVILGSSPPRRRSRGRAWLRLPRPRRRRSSLLYDMFLRPDTAQARSGRRRRKWWR
jgi:hypothetical protein